MTFAYDLTALCAGLAAQHFFVVEEQFHLSLNFRCHTRLGRVAAQLLPRSR